jgi:transketolase
MRFELVRAIYETGLENKNLFFITGDFGHAKNEEFKRDFAGRYFNGGMSEQNIIGMAAGLALSGKQAVVYSIVPFITLRCYEQIKIDVCDQNVNVIVVGGGGGFAYGSAGATHYSIEELAALRALPNMKIVCPADPEETYNLTRQILKLGGPAYIRIGRGKEASLPIPREVVFGKAISVRPGEGGTIFASGTILSEALKAAEILATKGIDMEVVNMHTLKPLDKEAVLARAGKGAIFTLEEHSVLGGLGSAVAEVLMESRVRPKVFKSFGINDAWPEVVGSQEYLRDITGISAVKVAGAIEKLL